MKQVHCSIATSTAALLLIIFACLAYCSADRQSIRIRDWPNPYDPSLFFSVNKLNPYHFDRIPFSRNWPAGALLLGSMLINGVIWQTQRGKARIAWQILLVTLFLVHELLQYFHIRPGTFDIVDLIFCILASLIARIILSKYWSLCDA